MKSGRTSRLAFMAVAVVVVSVVLMTLPGRDNDLALAQSVESEIVTMAITPKHLPVREAVESISEEYNEFLTTNRSRNLILFKGPEEILVELRRDIDIIDSRPSHLEVDLHVCQLTENAKKTLCEKVTRTLARAKNPPITAADVARSSETFAACLDRLIEAGEATVLTHATTVSASGRQTELSSRNTLNYFYEEGADDSNHPVVKKSDISADTEGLVVATLLPDGDIHLLVEVQVGRFAFTPDSGLPESMHNRLNTEVTVQDGQTWMLGALQPSRASQAKNRSVADATGSSQQENRKDVLTLFVTAKTL